MIRRQRALAQAEAATTHDSIRCYEALNKLAQSLVKLKSDSNPDGRELFSKHYDDAIKEFAQGLPNPNSAGSYQTALKNMWTLADQEEWNSKAKIEMDIYALVTAPFHAQV
jgi:3-dehydroquinate dehydratase